jgi:hypothetical protein
MPKVSIGNSLARMIDFANARIIWNTLLIEFHFTDVTLLFSRLSFMNLMTFVDVSIQQWCPLSIVLYHTPKQVSSYGDGSVYSNEFLFPGAKRRRGIAQIL